MTTIINIETSGKICSVALSRDGVVEFMREDTEGMKHAERLAPFLEQTLEEVARRDMKVDAVAVSIGPGSYTGLRIGLSMAKGLAMGLDVPLIAIDTLQILAVKAMFANRMWTGEELLVPMIDARRMEVYTAVYDFALREVRSPAPLIIEPDSLSYLPADASIWLMGDGAEKAFAAIKRDGVNYLPGFNPHARDMTALAEKAFRENRFADLAYEVPKYLKEYQTTVARNKVIGK